MWIINNCSMVIFYAFLEFLCMRSLCKTWMGVVLVDTWAKIKLGLFQKKGIVGLGWRGVWEILWGSVTCVEKQRGKHKTQDFILLLPIPNDIFGRSIYGFCIRSLMYRRSRPCVHYSWQVFLRWHNLSIAKRYLMNLT